MRQYDKEFGQKGFKIGATANVRRPPRYFGTFGPALNVEPSVETYVPVSILYQFHVDLQFNTINMKLDIDEFEPRFIKPACVAVGNRIDSDGLYFGYQNTALAGGTAGTAPTSFKTFSDARAYLVSEGAPRDQTPCVILHPLAHSSMADALKGLFNPQQHIAENYEEGLIAMKTAGFDWYEDQNVPVFTTGAAGGTPTLAGIANGTASGGTACNVASGWIGSGTFETSGWTSSANPRVTVGDILQVAGVYPVNPQNRGQYGTALKQFVVIPPAGYAPMVGAAAAGGPQFATATLAHGTFNATTGVYSSTSGGLLTLTVAEAMITGGQFQNCASTTAFTGTPAITVNGGAAASTASTQNIAFYRDAFALAFVDLPLPRTAAESSIAFDEELGLSLRVVTSYTINNDAEPTRIDVAYGFGSLYRQQAYRILG